jgi:hypothetical protein
MKRCCVLAGALVLAACARPVPMERTLSHELLTNGGVLDAALELNEFAVPEDARVASNLFNARLILDTEEQDNDFELLLDELNLVTLSRPGIDELPDFDFMFVQDGEFLVPVTTGPVLNNHSWWEYVFSTGRTWDEDGDKGWSRAAIPFALKELREDCIHNGLMTFLYRDDGRVSNVVFQVANQTCRYLQFEMRGVLAARSVPLTITNADAVKAMARRHRENRLPVRPMASIVESFPGTRVAAFGSVDEIDPEDMSLYGFLIDGVHYVGGCETPYGAYPYCDEMALPSYSTAKSVVGGLGLMLLEAAYPGAAQSPINGLVPQCGDSWKDVTIEHALDMTTGHFGSPELYGDEDNEINGQFFAADHAGKIDVACNGFPRKTEPGTHLSYHTWDTYLAGTAMNSYLRQQQGSDADFFDDLLVQKIWKPLELSRLAASTRRTYDEVRQPYSGFGLTLLSDDIAKLARFIGPMDGRIDDADLLDRRLFDAIKQRVPGDPGKVTELETIRYNNGFRSFDVSSYLGCEEPAWVVVLSGFGGIIVAIMPNDTVYYYFSDGNVHRYLSAVRESHRIRPMCGESGP